MVYWVQEQCADPAKIPAHWETVMHKLSRGQLAFSDFNQPMGPESGKPADKEVTSDSVDSMEEKYAGLFRPTSATRQNRSVWLWELC